MDTPDPRVGRWFQKRTGRLVQVVALDGLEGTVEIQHFDGTIEELELDQWANTIMQSAAAPEDWHGSVDVGPEDFLFDDEETQGHPALLGPLDYVDRLD